MTPIFLPLIVYYQFIKTHFLTKLLNLEVKTIFTLYSSLLWTRLTEPKLSSHGTLVISLWTEARNEVDKQHKKIGICWRYCRVLGEFPPNPLASIHQVIVPENARRALLVRHKNALRQRLRVRQAGSWESCGHRHLRDLPHWWVSSCGAP